MPGNTPRERRPSTPTPEGTLPCRDCQRPIRWCREVSDPRGPRCWDCQAARRKARK